MTTSRLALDEEARGIEQELRMSQFRDEFVVRSLWAPRPLDLLRGFNEARPTIVHFAGHGAGSKGLVLPDEGGRHVVIAADALRRLFESFPHTIRMVVLNACFSQEQCEHVKDAIGCAIGMTTAIGDAAARRFAGALYGALGAGCSVKTAFDQAVTLLHIYAEASHDSARDAAATAACLTPPAVLCCRSEVDPSRIYFALADQTGSGAPSLEIDVATVVHAARRALNGLDERERASAVKLLANTDTAEARAALVDALRHPVRMIRIAAAQQFPDQSDARILRGLIEGLADDDRCGTSQWEYALLWPFHDAVRAAGAAAVPELLAVLEGASPLPSQVVVELAKALGTLSDARAVPALTKLAHHAERDVRSAALDSLATLGAVFAAPELRVLLHDDDSTVRADAATCLGRLGDRGAVPELRRLLHRDGRWVRRAAAHALSLLRDAKAVPDLLASLTDPDDGVRVAAAMALKAVNHPAGSDHLRAHLEANQDRSNLVNSDIAVMVALIPDGDPQVLAMIERRITIFRSGSTPQKVVEALATVGSQGEAILIRILGQDRLSSSVLGCAAEALSRSESPEAVEAVMRWQLQQ